MGARTPELSLTVQFAVAAQGLPSRARLRTWVQAALERDAEVTLRVVGLVEGRRLNRDFRGKDRATNVLTFLYSEPGQPALGDIVLCAPVALAEAQAQGKALQAHWAHLVVHGTLHLQGYDHEREDEAAAMEARETEILTALRYPDPYGQDGLSP